MTGPAVPLGAFRVLLLDMHSTFMFGEDRFGAGEDFASTYAGLGGGALAPDEVDRVVRAAHAFLAARYADPAFEDDFPSVAEALRTVAPKLPRGEWERLVATFGYHERGTVPPAFASALRRLSATHELRLISNIWAPKDPWVEELERSGVLSLFTRAVFSSDCRSMKPSPRLFERALHALRCSPDAVLMVGDSLRCDAGGGRRAGLRTAWIAPPSATPEPAMAAWVDYRISSLLSLAAGP